MIRIGKYIIGSDEGNSGALLRWGKRFDNGIWFKVWRFRKLWFKFKFMKNYLDFGIFCIHYGN